MDRMISLGVGTEGMVDFVRTFDAVTELAGKLGENHAYVSVSSSTVGEADTEPNPEELYYDENTLLRVRRAIMEIGLSTRSTDDIINNLQNAGILFRERLPRV